MTNRLETIKSWWSPEIKYDWQKEHQETSNLVEIQKGIPHLHPMTIPDYKKKLGLPRKIGIAKKLGLPEEQPEVSEIPKKSLELAKPRSKPLNLFQQYWRENMKVTIQNDWSKGRHSRRTTRTYNPMQCIFMFCIVLQSCVYLYTQFQNPPAR